MLKKILAGVLCACLFSSAFATESTPVTMQPIAATDQIIVKLKPLPQTRRLSSPRAVVEAAVDAVGLGIHASYGRAMTADTHVIQLPAPMTLQEASDYATVLSSDPAVEYAEPDVLMYPDTVITPNDSAFTNQWQHASPNVYAGADNLPAAWGETSGSANVVVAVVDSGVINHRDLAPRLVGGSAALAGYDFISRATVGNDGDGRDSNPIDPGDWVGLEDIATPSYSTCGVRNSSWHGTHVAGTIGAVSNNAQGVAGVDWNARLLIARAMGKCGGYLSDIAEAIRWSAGETINGVSNPNPAHIINLSLGGSGACGPTYQDAIDAAMARGAVLVTTAGNGGTDVSNHRPANCTNVITVTALERDGSRPSFANTGSRVDIAAPGVSILSTLDGGKTGPANDNAYAYYKGTSVAAPHVSGVLALMLAANSRLTDGSIPSAELPLLLKQKLKASARPFVRGTASDCTTSTCGTGALDAYRAVMAVKTPPTANAGANQAVQVGASVTLHGSGADNTPAGAITRYDWEQTAGMPVSLSNRNSANPVFVAPAGAGTLTFRLTVTNNVGLGSSSYTNVTVAATGGSSCDPVSLTPGGSAPGQWDTACASSHRGSDRYARYYTFTLNQPATVTVDLASTQDTFLYLLQGSGADGSVLTYNDDSNGSTNSRIVRALPAGTYTLEATTYYTQRTGSFTLSLTTTASNPVTQPCTINPLGLGQQASGQWAAGCASVHRSSNHYAGYYSFTLTAAAKVTIDLASQQDTFLYLLEGNDSQGALLAFNDDSNGTLNSRIVRTLPAGTYTLEATTYAAARTGTFTLGLSTVSETDSCVPASLTLGQNTVGCWNAACVSAHRGSTYYAGYYRFSLAAPATVTLDLNSLEQDTFLYLLEGSGSQGEVLAFNDDSNGTLNSQITRTLSAGTYTLEATTYAAGSTGAFTVRVH
ncbi:S8 family peptidase [Thiothrix nivea]|uniref:Peptidase S8 and S53 subtilisin kexin sedolisin n=1 Tax=Thiothrix nivea (strain ATCC 35100 / DSM 5205 / JP2) TaxID=870187 RepID=A0A656HDY0_THINJ|nr:S8 family peptidase [Thiothrix nivea]EIJ34184.1 peptidase S8 and S53 subtilisin kexin sedolisin [Thiothrix nivea DSM 5205]